MKKFFATHCRLVLIISFLLIFFPSFGVSMINLREIWRLENENNQKSGMFFAELIAVRQRYEIDETQKMLKTLSETGAYNLDTNSCNEIMDKIAKNNPKYTYIGVADMGGNLICGSLASDNLNIYYREYFQEMMEKRSSIIGDYNIGALSGKPNIPFVQPIFDSSGQITGAIMAFRDLSWTKNISELNLNLPEDMFFFITDSQGRIIEHFPSNDKKYIGESIKDNSLGQVMFEKGEKGILKSEGMDGTRRFYSFLSFSAMPESEKTCIIVGMGKEVDLMKIVSSTLPNAVLLLGIAVLALIVARRECISCRFQNAEKAPDKE